jgi:F-type H+-transporting ATPase subunit b
MPQLNQLFLVYQSQWFWLLLVLAFIYVVMGKGMVPRIEKVVDDRNAQINGDLAAAERARAAADEAEERARLAEEAARADAHAFTGQAKAAAAKDTEGLLAQADAEIAAKLTAAEASLATARDEALRNLENVAAEAARDVVAKVSGATVSAEQAASKVKAVLANG